MHENTMPENTISECTISECTRYLCTLEKEGFLGTFYESKAPTDKAIILVGGSGEKREFVEKRAEALWEEGFHVLSLGY